MIGTTLGSPVNSAARRTDLPYPRDHPRSHVLLHKMSGAVSCSLSQSAPWSAAALLPPLKAAKSFVHQQNAFKAQGELPHFKGFSSDKRDSCLRLLLLG